MFYNIFSIVQNREVKDRKWDKSDKTDTLLTSVARQKYPLTMGDSALASTTVRPVSWDWYLVTVVARLLSPASGKLVTSRQWSRDTPASTSLSSTAAPSASASATAAASEVVVVVVVEVEVEVSLTVEVLTASSLGMKLAGVTTWTEHSRHAA